MTYEYKPTPTPWMLEDRREQGEGFSIKSPSAHYSSCLVAHYIGETDAKFIVHACNSHAVLVGVYEEAKRVMDLLEKHGTDTNENCGQRLRELVKEYEKLSQAAEKAGE